MWCMTEPLNAGQLSSSLSGLPASASIAVVSERGDHVANLVDVQVDWETAEVKLVAAAPDAASDDVTTL